MNYKVKILMTEFVTHNVKRFILEKPSGYKFEPGQATDVSINHKGWENNKHPFTFTSLNEHLVLEFTIKGYPVEKYPDHEGVTEKLHKLVPGDELLLEDPWGTINYMGKGTFFAGGAGITPFIAILRQLKKDRKISGHSLIFSNKLKEDVILEKEFRNMFSEVNSKLVLTLTREKVSGYEYGRIDEGMVKKYINEYSQHFYVCGPKQFVADIKEILKKLGASSNTLVFEE